MPRCIVIALVPLGSLKSLASLRTCSNLLRRCNGNRVKDHPVNYWLLLGCNQSLRELLLLDWLRWPRGLWNRRESTLNIELLSLHCKWILNTCFCWLSQLRRIWMLQLLLLLCIDWIQLQNHWLLVSYWKWNTPACRNLAYLFPNCSFLNFIAWGS